MKILILTTEPQWKTWDSKLSALRGCVKLVKNLREVTIEVEQFYDHNAIRVTENRVDRAWFNTVTITARERGYHAVLLHMSEDKAREIGIRGVRGVAINDEHIGEMYVIADEASKVRYPSGRIADRFCKVAMHELSHWIAKRLNVEDRTHYYDYELEAVWRAFMNYEWEQGLLERILNAIRRERMQPPLATWEYHMITQPFGVKNKSYTSGIHAGVDLHCVVGTPVYAPTDGHITAVWRNSKTLGNACLFEFYYNGKPYTLRMAHLRDAPKKGGYRKGSVIARTGNTGMSTGPHLHLELWRGGYEYDVLLDETLVRERLGNPFVFFKLLSNK